MSRPSLITVYASAAGALACASIIAAGSPRDLLSIATQETHAAAAFFAESITIDQLQRAYRGTPTIDPVTLAPRTDANAVVKELKVLIVPGHEPSAGGTAFGDVYERDVVVDLADALARHLSANPRYKAKVARSNYAWDPELEAYFAANEAAILAFRAEQALLMAGHLASGSVTLAEDPIDHLSTPTAGAIKLYGINKWTAEVGYDIVLHLHINDYPRPRGSAGKHVGFAVYVPDAQYSNANASRAIGEAVAYRLAAYHPSSSLPKEGGGVIPDQQLIALGSNNSAESATVLIEYGYIYEPQFQNPAVRTLAVEDYAYATYLGLQDFFKDAESTTGSVAVPYDWGAPASGAEGYALQATLRHLGYYPPPGKTLYDCPISGTVGPCTKASLRSYERAAGLTETGTLSEAVRASFMQKAGPDPFAASRVP